MRPRIPALPPPALRLLAVTARHWRLGEGGPLSTERGRTAQRASIAPPPGQVGQTTPLELRRWPYWPHYPGAAIGWR
jgi:hypothetical protein